MQKRKALSLFLALVMVLGLSVPAMAAEDATISVEQYFYASQEPLRTEPFSSKWMPNEVTVSVFPAGTSLKYVDTGLLYVDATNLETGEQAGNWQEGVPFVLPEANVVYLLKGQHPMDGPTSFCVMIEGDGAATEPSAEPAVEPSAEPSAEPTAQPVQGDYAPYTVQVTVYKGETQENVEVTFEAAIASRKYLNIRDIGAGEFTVLELKPGSATPAALSKCDISPLYYSSEGEYYYTPLPGMHGPTRPVVDDIFPECEEAEVIFIDNTDVCLILAGMPLMETSAPAPKVAQPSTQTVNVDGKNVEFAMYALEGGSVNYIRARDLAALLNGTAAQFEVGWDQYVQLTSKTPYTGSADKAPLTAEMPYTDYSYDPTFVDGKAVFMDAIQMEYGGGGYTYYKLRDLAQALDFNVGWSAEKGVYVETDKPYDPNN